MVGRVLKPIKPSREECHTLILVTEGSYRMKIGFKEYTITPNQIVVLQAGVVFSTTKLSQDVKGFTCHFHPNILIGKFGNRSLIFEFEFLVNGNYPIIEVSQHAKKDILNLYKRLALEFKKDGKPKSEIIHAYLFTLLTELKFLFGSSIALNQNAPYRITSQFRMLVQERIKENLRVSDYAKMLNISPNHLNKSVKAATSKSATEMIVEMKLIEIKYLLYQSDLSLSEISYEVGFQDASYFTRFFKKHEKIAPTQFRKLIESS
ncbi:MAG: helix-turn-helix domain-containing protein [Flavobacteriales bacterium]|nr:helix-turn-helix domain-containing protein [Flavobacteriales bacterium]